MGIWFVFHNNACSSGGDRLFENNPLPLNRTLSIKVLQVLVYARAFNDAVLKGLKSY